MHETSDRPESDCRSSCRLALHYNATMFPKKEVLWFLLINLLLSTLIYNDAMWGKSLLAPLDIGPAAFSQYGFMDPASDGVPDNHHIIDQFTYDLPLQHTIYEAYHSGEIPWWDPYTFGGRPLLADAHINGTDPIRMLCYSVLPFELAYNWNLILRGIITGLGMFLLLRHFKIDYKISIILSLTYQFSGWFTVYFGHPWIQGSFVYFPYLWIAWTKAIEGDLRPQTGLAAILCAMVFYAGNLQSHTYLPVFALSFLATFAIRDRKRFLKACAITVLSGIIGALIAFPVLYNQIEFYLISVRPLRPGNPWYQQLLATPLSFAAIYPWMFGTFRTLDVARLCNLPGIAFQWFCGIGPLVLACWGAWTLRKKTGPIGHAIFQATFLVVCYLIIVSTPLNSLLYQRCVPLAGMGIIVLAAFTIQALLDHKIAANPKLVKMLLLTIVTISTTTSALAWWAYPLFKERIQEKVDLADKSNSALVSIPKLRQLQVENFSRETSLTNPECAFTVLASLALALALMTGKRKNMQNRMIAALALSAIPVILFHTRFRPHQPIELWNRLLAGGPAQNMARNQLSGGLRLDESTTNVKDEIFPLAFAALYHVHCVQGYSALQPPCLYVSTSPPDSFQKDWRSDFDSKSRPDVSAPLNEISGTHPSRFRSSQTGLALPIKPIRESQNRLILDTSAISGTDSFIRTDTWYPGWSAKKQNSPLTVSKYNPCMISVQGLSVVAGGITEMDYTPRSLTAAIPIMSAGMLLCGYLLSIALFRPKSKVST